jgi:HTH-type transcriptional regulator/antitoxin HigA
LSAPEEIRRIQGILSETGIRFVIVEAFQGSKVDGVCFWLDENSPVIAISIRFDRIDWFWFTLIHELRHIANGDGKDAAVIDLDLVGDDSDREDINEVEQRADKEACEFLIQMDELSNFITRVRPLYAEVKVVGFADRMNVHPGIVVGRLQKLKEIPYANLRKHLVKIRYILAQSALMDGWQIALPSD